MQKLKEFQNHINTAINAYLNKHHNKEPISKRKQDDIKNIKESMSGKYSITEILRKAC